MRARFIRALCHEAATMEDTITNKQIVKILKEVADLYRMKDVQFKPGAYDRAAEAVSAMETPVSDMYTDARKDGLESIDGVGSSIAGHIAALIEDGTFDEYEKLKEEFPVDVSAMTNIEGVGPQTVHDVYTQLDVKNIEQMKEAVKKERIRTMDGYGVQTEQNIAEAISFYLSHHDRFLFGDIQPHVDELLADIRAFDEVVQGSVAGSIRRSTETVGDIDILTVAEDGESVIQKFCNLSVVADVHESGETKARVRLENEIDADLRVVAKDSWGAALHYFTGSKEHNVEIRTRAEKSGMTLNEYGLFTTTDSGEKKKRVAGEDETGIYNALNLAYIPPEMRENTGEIKAAEAQYAKTGDGLPNLVTEDDIRGDLHMHTTATDGNASIHEMATAADKRGYEYIAITDHTKKLAMASGLDAAEIRSQIQKINDINARLQMEECDVTVLAGSEVDILQDGSLDIPDDVLADLDIVGAAVHSHMNLPEEKQTQRLLQAIEHPHVDIIFHLTARRLHKREPIALDIEKIINAAAETNTVLEIDASPERLDIHDRIIRQCVEAGVTMSIDSDAHSPADLDYMGYGVSQARRGWATADDIINSFSLAKLRSFLDNKERNVS